jgi:hypothetical protein
MTGQEAVLTAVDERAREAQIASYLRLHPEFFERHTTLLEDLRIPHVRAGAVSLVERQVEALRGYNTQLQQRIQELFAVARDNDHLSRRLHQLTLALIDAGDISEVLNALEDQLHEEFRADAVELRLFSPEEVHQRQEIGATTHQEAGSLPTLEWLRSGQPWCGEPTALPIQGLFAEAAADLGSAALLPLEGEGIMGVLAIGSVDPRRFHPHKGTELLVRLGEIVSHKLRAVSLPGT